MSASSTATCPPTWPTMTSGWSTLTGSWRCRILRHRMSPTSWTTSEHAVVNCSPCPLPQASPGKHALPGHCSPARGSPPHLPPSPSLFPDTPSALLCSFASLRSGTPSLSLAPLPCLETLGTSEHPRSRTSWFLRSPEGLVLSLAWCPVEEGGLEPAPYLLRAPWGSSLRLKWWRGGGRENSPVGPCSCLHLIFSPTSRAFCSPAALQ